MYPIEQGIAREIPALTVCFDGIFKAQAAVDCDLYIAFDGS